MENRQTVAVYLRAMRTLAVYALFAAVMSLALLFCVFFSYSFTQRPLRDQLDFDMFQYPFIVQTILIPFFLSSLLRLLAQRDTLMRDTLYPGAEAVGSFTQRMRAVLGCKHFWIQLATLALPISLLPLQVGFFPVYFLLAHTPLPPFAAKLIFICAALPLLFGISLYHHTTAFFLWQEEELSCRPEQKKSFWPPVLGTAGLYFVFLLFLAPLLKILLAAFSMLASISFSLVGVAVLVILGLVLLFKLLRAIRIRHVFLRNLRQRCEKNGFTLSEIKRPYRSLFHPGNGPDFTVNANGKRYDCRLLAAFSRGNAMAISPEGIAHVIHVIGLRILPRRHLHLSAEFLGGPRRALGGNTWYTHMELFRFTTKTDFHFASDAKKILIVNPVPYALFAGTERAAAPIDNGDHVGDYTVFAGSAFLNALERDCADR